MFKILIATFTLTLLTTFAFAQKIDSLKLLSTEVPSGYSSTNNLLCKTVHAASFYDQTDLYASFLGNVTKKEFQSFGKKGDKGSILYFEFDKEFQGQSFLEGLLWGEKGKPTKTESDEYWAKGNVLIIWSFAKDSEIKKISQAKVTTSFQ